MGNNPVGKKVNTPKGKYLGKYLFTFGIMFLLEPSYSVVNYRRTLNRATMDINTCDCVKLTECSSYAQSVEHTMVKGTLLISALRC